MANSSLDECAYHDGSPLTILAEETVTYINSRLRQKVDIGRFRPNIVLSGCLAFEESEWTSLRVVAKQGDGAESVALRVLMDCYRCTMVTIEQSHCAEQGTRPSGLEVTAQLKKIRVQLTPACMLSVWFDVCCPATTHGPLPREDPNVSVFAVLDQESAQLRVGDAVTIAGRIEDAGSPSIYCFNLDQNEHQFEINEDRFWVRTGPKAK